MKEMWNSKKVCQWAGISDATLTRWTQEDENGETFFPKAVQHKRRGKRLWTEESLLAWAERNLSGAQQKIEAPEKPAKIEQRFKNACAELEKCRIRVPRAATPIQLSKPEQ